jgi:hypothetical protein
MVTGKNLSAERCWLACTATRAASNVTTAGVRQRGLPQAAHAKNDTFKAAHCGFHVFGATTSFTTITNSVIEGMSYGVMAFTTKPNFKNNVFKGNANDAGFCFGATAATKPIFDGNYYASGAAVFDASCVQAGTTSTNTATAAIPGAGPVGL